MQNNANHSKALLTIDELAEYLGKPKATLYSWRTRGLGPKATRVGRDLRYRMVEVEAWLDAQTEGFVGEFGQVGHQDAGVAEPPV